MSTEINPNLNTNYIRLNLGDNSVPKYYIIKKEKADSFSSAYQKRAQKTSIITNTAFIGSVLGGTFLTMFATAKIKSPFIRYAINCAGGVIAGLASLPLTGKYAKSKEDKLVAKYGAVLEK